MMGLSYTTIYPSGEFLKRCIDNITKYGWQDEVFITIVGDKKTPIQDLTYAKESGIKCTYFDVEQQEKWLKDYPKLDIPYNSDNRRNLGFLKSLEEGADIVVSLDDDNLFRADIDFVGYHKITGEYKNGYKISSNNNWFNACDLLLIRPEVEIFIRGFPFSKRKGVKYNKTISGGKIVVNMGLWFGVPDVNSMTLLEIPGVKSIDKSGLWSIWLNDEDQILVDENTMTVINSQNTSLSRMTIPCYYYPKVPEILFRFPDIWSGFFLKKCVDAVGDSVAIGMPLVEHDRNIHNLLEDFYKESVAIKINEKLVDLLDDIQLSSKKYVDAYLELIDYLEINVNKLGGLKIQGWFKEIFGMMRIWVDICEVLV